MSVIFPNTSGNGAAATSSATAGLVAVPPPVRGPKRGSCWYVSTHPLVVERFYTDRDHDKHGSCEVKILTQRLKQPPMYIQEWPKLSRQCTWIPLRRTRRRRRGRNEIVKSDLPQSHESSSRRWEAKFWSWHCGQRWWTARHSKTNANLWQFISISRLPRIDRHYRHGCRTLRGLVDFDCLMCLAGLSHDSGNGERMCGSWEPSNLVQRRSAKAMTAQRGQSQTWELSMSAFDFPKLGDHYPNTVYPLDFFQNSIK